MRFLTDDKLYVLEQEGYARVPADDFIQANDMVYDVIDRVFMRADDKSWTIPVVGMRVDGSEYVMRKPLSAAPDGRRYTVKRSPLVT